MGSKNNKSSYSFVPSWQLSATHTLGRSPYRILIPSDYDVHQNFSAALSYDIPTPAWGGAAGKAILGGWAMDGVYKLQSGQPIDVVMFAVSPALGQTIIVRPALVPGQPIWIIHPTQPGGKALNSGAFTLAAGGVSDEALRNAIRSPLWEQPGRFRSAPSL